MNLGVLNRISKIRKLHAYHHFVVSPSSRRRVREVAFAGVQILIDVPEQRRVALQLDRQIVLANLGREQSVLFPSVFVIFVAVQSVVLAASESVLCADG